MTGSPHTSATVNVTVDKVRVDIPFNASIHITGKANRLDEDGNVRPMTNVNANAIRCYLQKENYDIKNIKVEGDSLIINTSGVLKVEGYGLGTLIEAHPIEDPDVPKGPPGDLPDEPRVPNLPHTPDPEKEPKTPNPPYIPDHIFHLF